MSLNKKKLSELGSNKSVSANINLARMYDESDTLFFLSTHYSLFEKDFEHYSIYKGMEHFKMSCQVQGLD